jgi:hypothetical protein
MPIGRGTLQEQAAHLVMASALMAGSNIQTENFHYWFRTFDLDACTCMEHAHQIICTHSTPDVTHILGQVQAKVLCPHPSPMHSLFPRGGAIKQIHGRPESIFFIHQYFTWVEEVLFILSEGNPPTLGIWYNLILRYSGSFLEHCRQLIFFCCNRIPIGNKRKLWKGKFSPPQK